ncbi:ATP-dependent DNA helicase II subunit 2 [Schaereria dolodes]|nr:ATP-dependent DNA helicase II subunit 2 [Schaereria dolodes]
MAEKEATVYIVDVGLSMGKRHAGRKQSDIDWAMTYIWDKITSTVATERKTAVLGVIGLRTDGTANELEDEESFSHISVIQEISQILLPDLRRMRQAIKLSSTDEGDAISAVVIAIQMITKYCKKLKYQRKVVLVTDGCGSLDADGISEITKKIKEDAMELVVLGVDFDDFEYGFKEEDKEPGKYEQYMNMSTSCVIIAQKTNSKAILALSSVIHALFELESFAVARLVTKNDRPPMLVLLAPSIEIDYECLLDVQLPFAEDVRSYKFPALDRVVTVSGKVLKEHRNLPTAALSSAMSDYVDRMDLSGLGRDEEGNPTEYMALTDTFSPVLHRIDQAVRWRAIYPAEPVPPPYEILTRYSKPPEELQTKSKRLLDKLIAAADVKKVPPKLKGRKRNRDQVKPLSGLNVDELLGRRNKKAKISRENPIPEFKQMLEAAEDPNTIQEAAEQLSNIIEAQISESFGDSAYGQVVEELGVLREEMTDMDEPGLYNEFVRRLKHKLLADELGGDRREMWWEIKRGKLGLIEKGEGPRRSPLSVVTEGEAKQVCSVFVSSLQTLVNGRVVSHFKMIRAFQQ